MKEIPSWLGVLYLVFLYGIYIQRFALMLHYSEHRKLFPKASIWNLWIPYVLCPFFGIPSGLYFAHHVIMHHQENNFTGWDVSSTEPYQRDHFGSFLHYWLRWIFGVWVALPYYLFKRKQWNLFSNLITMLSVWGIALVLLYKINPQATFWIFLLPVFVTQLLFSFGNYSQHIFIDPQRPNDNYALTYCCINATDNQYSFNDGYHITHHINARLHWSLMPQRFLDNLDKYIAADAIIFHSIGFFDVGLMTFTRQWKKLASHVVQIGPKKRSDEELINMFKYRCTPVVRSLDEQPKVPVGEKEKE